MLFLFCFSFYVIRIFCRPDLSSHLILESINSYDFTYIIILSVCYILKYNYNTGTKLCASALEVVGEENDEWRTRVQSEKFKCHNQHWLEMVDNQTSQPLEDHLLTFNLDNNLDQHLLLSRQFYHDQVAAANDFDGNDSYLGGFIEDAEALDHTDFYYGDEGYKRPPSVAGFNRDSLTYNNSFSSYHLEDYDADLLLNNSYSFGNN